MNTRPHNQPLYLTSVWECDDPQQADEILGGQREGYVYRREAHPNADALVEACCKLHKVDHGVATSSGMAAMAAAVLAVVRTGDHVLFSDRLYGKTTYLLTKELSRLGVECTQVDMRNLDAVRSVVQPATRLFIAETIANPCLEIVDIGALAEIAHKANAKLLIDNTFATPYVCRPSEWGADLVMESLTKLMNGHGDVLLGFLGSMSETWPRVPGVVSAWGFCSSPLDCWLALRGLGTMELRLERACGNALSVAQMLAERGEVERVDYPGLPSHAQHDLAARQFGGRYGAIVTFHLRRGREAAERFIATKRIPFCPSLGDIATTLSHPESTSHRALSAQQREALGITGGTIRLSVGIEPGEEIIAALREGLG